MFIFVNIGIIHRYRGFVLPVAVDQLMKASNNRTAVAIDFILSKVNLSIYLIVVFLFVVDIICEEELLIINRFVDTC